MQPMKIVIPGGTGQVGNLLAHHFHSSGHAVVVLARTPQPAPWRVVAWDANTLGDWSAELDAADVVINLAGRNVNCRYTPENRRAIMDSRVNSTTVLGAAIATAARPPRLWLQASTATIYSHRHDAPNDDIDGQIGGQEPDAPAKWRFSIEVAQAWERAQAAAPTPHTRKVAMRSALILSPDRGGIFDTLLTLVRLGAGGPVAGGRMYISWLHAADFIRSVEWLIEREEFTGPVNLAAPQPLPQAEFMRILRRAYGLPIGVPAAAWMTEIAAFFMQTETELILKSRRVVPRRLLESGFQFEYPEWEAAARDLCTHWRATNNK